MRLLSFKSLAIMAALGFAILLGAAADTSAQSRREIERERQRYERQQQRIARQNARIERQRREERMRRSRDYSDNDPYNSRMTRRDVNATHSEGYQQGLLAGQSDRRDGKYNRFNVYRNTGSAPNSGDPSSADYLYRQSYLQGYEDGFHGRMRY